MSKMSVKMPVEGKTAKFRRLLSEYYNNYFPFELCYQWLSYGEENNFQNREFNFVQLDDKYMRYKSFASSEELKISVGRSVPMKIDIGAIYTSRPKDKLRTDKIKVDQHELVIDIDISDYDEVRTCCSGGKICGKCWKYLSIACKVLDAALREDFGFVHILWVFSGRRGIHAWVCDKDARYMDKQARRVIAESLQVISGGAYIKKKVNLSGRKIDYPTHRALDMIRKCFVEICIEEQDILGTDERIHKFLAILPSEELRNEIEERFRRCNDGSQRWNVFVDYIQEHVQPVKNYCHIIEEVMLQYIYPRIDMNVTKDATHLLKIPFSIHPKSRKVSIPFDPQKTDEFDLLTVPTLDGLIERLEDVPREKMFKTFNESRQVLHQFVNKMRNCMENSSIAK